MPDLRRIMLRETLPPLHEQTTQDDKGQETMNDTVTYNAWKDWAGIFLRAIGYLGGFFLILTVIKYIIRGILL